MQAQMTKKPVRAAKKVLFCDVDGVLNSRDTTDFKNNLYPIDPYMAFLVGKIQLDTGCDVVLSSSWRHHPDGIAAFEKACVPVIDITPSISFRYEKPITARGRTWEYSLRGEEVKQWLDKHPEVDKYAILDDDNDFYDDQPLFLTTFQHGLSQEIAKAVTEHLNG